MNTQENKGYYIRIDDQDITVSKEIRDAWNKPKDKTWYEARKIGACRCPSFRICTGDCGTCKWNTQGKVISYDDERYHDLFVNGCTARISDETGIPQKTVYRRLQKILLDLQKHWDKYE